MIRPTVRVAVLLSRVGVEQATIEFLIDTGATFSTLHPNDALFVLGIDSVRLSVPYIWPDKEPSLGIGGMVEDYVEPAEYVFTHEDGTTQTIVGHIRIAQPTAYNQQFPSLLGWDVLRHFRMVIDAEAGELRLESRG